METMLYLNDPPVLDDTVKVCVEPISWSFVPFSSQSTLGLLSFDIISSHHGVSATELVARSSRARPLLGFSNTLVNLGEIGGSPSNLPVNLPLSYALLLASVTPSVPFSCAEENMELAQCLTSQPLCCGVISTA